MKPILLLYCNSSNPWSVLRDQAKVTCSTMFLEFTQIYRKIICYFTTKNSQKGDIYTKQVNSFVSKQKEYQNWKNLLVLKFLSPCMTLQQCSLPTTCMCGWESKLSPLVHCKQQDKCSLRRLTGAPAVTHLSPANRCRFLLLWASVTCK